jgi:hypothetical protein
MIRQRLTNAQQSENRRLTELREAYQQRVEHLNSRLKPLNEAFIYERAIDQRTYDEQRSELRDLLAVAEIQMNDAREASSCRNPGI